MQINKAHKSAKFRDDIYFRYGVIDVRNFLNLERRDLLKNSSSHCIQLAGKPWSLHLIKVEKLSPTLYSIAPRANIGLLTPIPNRY